MRRAEVGVAANNVVDQRRRLEQRPAPKARELVVRQEAGAQARPAGAAARSVSQVEDDRVVGELIGWYAQIVLRPKEGEAKMINDVIPSMIELDEASLDGVLEKGDDRVGLGGAHVVEAGVDAAAGALLDVWRALVPLRRHVDRSG